MVEVEGEPPQGMLGPLLGWPLVQPGSEPIRLLLVVEVRLAGAAVET